MTKDITHSSIHLNEVRHKVYRDDLQAFVLYKLVEGSEGIAYPLIEGSYEEVTEHFDKVFDMNVKMFQADVEHLKTQYVIIDRSKREVIYGNNEHYPKGSRY